MNHNGRPKALDLFCGAGGASMGLHRAGFEVTGVDIKPQPRYPFEFIQGDALTFPLEGYDFIWASPPCQAYTALKTMPNAKQDHPDLVDAIRQRLIASGCPYAIENVMGAPLLPGSTVLCGTHFALGTGDAELRRHRVFEASFMFLVQPCSHRAERVCGVYGGHGRDRRRTITVVSKQGCAPATPRTIGVFGHAGGSSKRDQIRGFSVAERKEAMDIDWMKDFELSQAIPPAYSQYIAEQFLKTVAA